MLPYISIYHTGQCKLWIFHSSKLSNKVIKYELLKLLPEYFSTFVFVPTVHVSTFIP